jgi:hypothetical protein
VEIRPGSGPSCPALSGAVQVNYAVYIVGVTLLALQFSQEG